MTPKSVAELEKEFYDAAMASGCLTHYDASIGSAGYSNGYLAGHASGLSVASELAEACSELSKYPDSECIFDQMIEALSRYKANTVRIALKSQERVNDAIYTRIKKLEDQWEGR